MSTTALPNVLGRDVRRTRRVTIERPKSRRYAIGIVPLTAVAALLLAGAGIGGWTLAGGRLLIMETPSMCPAVCVGSLVMDRPSGGTVHDGELITFHPPGDNAETFTHQVFRVLPNDTIQTRGLANSRPDPWLITRSDIVGKVEFSLWGLGWVFKALPFLALEVLCWVLVSMWVPGFVRRAWDRGWMTALVVLPALFFHPLIQGVVTSTAVDPDDHHLLRTTVVNTGILSSSFRAAGTRGLVQVPSAHTEYVTSRAIHGEAILHETASLPWWGWGILGLVIISPFAGYLWHMWRYDETLTSQQGPGIDLAT